MFIVYAIKTSLLCSLIHCMCARLSQVDPNKSWKPDCPTVPASTASSAQHPKFAALGMWQVRPSLVTFSSNKVGLCALSFSSWLLAILETVKSYYGSRDLFSWPMPLCRGGCCREVKVKANVSTVHQGRVVRNPVNANPGLKVNRRIDFSCMKMFFTS